ncbi:glutamate--cysteine ligase catalytic subunit-like [Diorhabda carinulata]|uniref:glutamate--cysteine ligase catalytic subunit-like n=1 Tax=Diorhabda carinulata TaxID=1163345 RepID=UPI0025A1E7C7|nr:glutamate--cysteine ligase catalytic subunit-like [Diorhabda carinulata]
MGLFDVGTPLSHEDTLKWAPYVRDHGITQFINLYKKEAKRKNDPFKWGDEIEYTLVNFNENKKEAKLSLTSRQVLEEIDGDCFKKNGIWTPEYAAFMIEGTPVTPYEGLNFVEVEENMRKRRKELRRFLKNGENLLCITSFPRMGCKNFTVPECEATPGTGLTKSRFYPDAAVCQIHPRYQNTTKNVLGRRGEKPFYNLPVFKDTNTKFPLDDCYKSEKNALPDHIYLDAMGFGSGYSCLQATFQASNINEARVLYDQLAPFCPIMMALTAAAPFHRGYITNIDTRWSVACNTHDCRTTEERGLVPLKHNKFVIPKSRYGSIDCYISPLGEIYNDSNVFYYEEDYKKLVNSGVDSLLAKHIAHLFIRDTISLFEENLYQNDEEETGHFENIQSTNWQSLRFKPPPPALGIGWRVEFRPCDLQITDFENAAVVCFLALLTRIILKYDLNFLIPLSKVDENIQRAQKPDAIIQQKFWFRKHIFQNKVNLKNGISKRNSKMKYRHINDKSKYSNGSHGALTNKQNGHFNVYTNEKLEAINGCVNNEKCTRELNSHMCKACENNNLMPERRISIGNGMENVKKYLAVANETDDNNRNTFEDNFVEMTINEILNGKKGSFLGIIPLMKTYLDNLDLNQANRSKINKYLNLMERKSTGELFTTAAWMRKFVTDHPKYRYDSIITEEINYDLLVMMQKIQNGEVTCPELLGDL